MIHLFLSIFFSVVTVSFFKLFDKYKVDTFQAIVANYISCVLMGNLFAEHAVITTPFWNEPWFPYTIICGFLFISVFYCIARTAQEMGVSVSMVAAKLSVMIPVVFALVLYGEQLSLMKGLGILLSLSAVVFISKKEGTGQTNKMLWFLPAAVFFGSGCIDTLLNFLESRFIPPADADGIVSSIFLVAFILGSCVIIYRKITSSIVLGTKNLAWGIALGIPNYFSMYYLVRTLQDFDGSFIFPVNNIGIVIFSTAAGIIFFRERLRTINWIGIVLAVISILIISFA